MLASCWDQPQVQLEVTRDDTMVDVDLQVCDETGSPCDPAAIAPLFNSPSTLKQRVSIFTSHPIVLLTMLPVPAGSKVCVQIATASHTLDRTLAVHDTGVEWCTSGCEPMVMCP